MIRPASLLVILSATLAFPAVAQKAAKAPSVQSVPQKPSPEPVDAVHEIASPAHPATEAQIREYLSLVRADKLIRDSLAGNLKAMQATSAPYYPAAMWDDARKALLNLDVDSTFVKVYQRYVSEEDMQAILNFYHSPAGKNLLAVQPMAMRDAQQIIDDEAHAIGVEIGEKYADQIQAAQKKYEAGQSGEIHLDAPDTTVPNTPNK